LNVIIVLVINIESEELRAFGRTLGNNGIC